MGAEYHPSGINKYPIGIKGGLNLFRNPPLPLKGGKVPFAFQQRFPKKLF
ncbi:hypothetical protein EYY60_16215 [Flavobacterium zhairuonense]|nr:hypothetical protein [Flavobacterium zhairuonense]KAF2508669.1 hypothetical protein EYY60_16215 [Flavobacterium zhairuonense]